MRIGEPRTEVSGLSREPLSEPRTEVSGLSVRFNDK